MGLTQPHGVCYGSRSINKGPSVLSEFMLISKYMEDSLLVNPWNLGVCVFFFFFVFLPF